MDSIHGISVNEHSSIRIKDDITGKVAYIDPFKIKNDAHDADIVLITHIHYDHFSPKDILMVANKDTRFVCPSSMKDKALDFLKGSSLDISHLSCVKPQDRIDIEGINIEAVRAYNAFKPHHPKKNAWVGYNINVNNEWVYVCGDTDFVKEIASVSCDVALVPVGGTFTMNAHEAARLVNELHPKIAIPTHYGSIVGSKKDADAFCAEVNRDIQTAILIKQ